jgi:murein L,D-transpeptidase YcbB/YkuD
MYNKKRLSVLIGLCGMLTFSAFAENDTLFSEDNSTLNTDSSVSNEVDSNGLNEVDSNDFYIESKPLIKGKEDLNGFAQKNTASIPAPYSGGGYAEMFDNEVMRLQELPLSEELFSKGKVLPVLREGDQGENVKILMSGLVSNGFLSEETVNQNVYNYDVTKAVKDAQDYYGISVDGISGKEVYRNLFIPKEERINEIKEWQSKIDEMVEVGRKEMKPYIVVVNIPSYTLHVIETNNKTEVLQSKVVVGKSSSQTPIGRSNLIGLKYNPTWTPPMSHIKKSVIPNMRIPSGMYVIDSKGNKIDTNDVTTDGLLNGRYSVQQPAGANNALGLLKFETDSPDSIYLHDTNHRAFFYRKGRALSMGCVRVQQWHELASILANSDKNYIFGNINKGKTYIQKIEHIPVFYTYSLVDNVDGKVGYFNDVYSRLN